MEAALGLARTGGRVVLVGAVSPTRPLAVDAEAVVRRLLSIRGLHNYVPADLVQAVDFLAQAESIYPLAELIGPQYPLAEADRAFEEAISGRSLRVGVRP
jgi:D-arabinose 1-dehydrogenase-like Zn-dependent alcohol dehydrogenase